MSNRFSVYSSHSTGLSSSRPGAQSPSPVTTTTLLNALHAHYNSGQPYQLDAGTSVVVNTWVTATRASNGQDGGTIDRDLGLRAWEHARRRAEDGCIVLW